MIRILLKSGVLGVLGVPESLQASNCAAFSDGTPLQKHENTCVQNTNGVPEKTYKACTSHPAQPDGDDEGAEGCKPIGVDDGKQLPGGTQRWSLELDEEDGDRKWVWNPSASDDIDELFERVDNEKPAPLDHKFWDACILDRFITQANWGEGTVEPWILERVTHMLFNVLSGGEWNDEIRLPGRPQVAAWKTKKQRDMSICVVTIYILKKHPDTKIVTAIQHAADLYCVSYETARAAYYKWRERLSRKPINT